MSYYYDYGTSDISGFEDVATGAVGAVLGVYLVILVLSLAVSVVTYVLQSLGTYTIAKRRGIHHPWMAWVPICNAWLLGSISDQYQYVAKGRNRSRRKVLLGLSIATYALLIPFYVAYFVLIFGMIAAEGSAAVGTGVAVAVIVLLALVMAVVAIVLSVFQYIAYYDLYASCDPSNAVMFLVLSIFFGITQPFFVFACRNKDLGMPPKKPRIPEPPVPPTWQQAWQPAAAIEPVKQEETEPAAQEPAAEPVAEEAPAEETPSGETPAENE